MYKNWWEENIHYRLGVGGESGGKVWVKMFKMRIDFVWYWISVTDLKTCYGINE